MKKNDNLVTPQYIIEGLGPFDLDPCAGIETNHGNVNYRIENGEDGLTLPWKGFVWCNPPFSEKMRWVQKMAQHSNGILLLPERGSAPWFGPLAEFCNFYFVMGRKINFIGGSSSNNVGSVLFPFGVKAHQRILNSNLPGHYVKVLKFTSR